MDIKDFLLARIAEDEAVAMHAGTPGRNWRATTREAGDSYMPGVEVVGKDYPMLDVWDDDQRASVDQSTHVARHDPARVLAECAAKRAIVTMHGFTRDTGWRGGEDNDHLWCTMCGSIDDAPAAWPCETLQSLAAIYSDHPDYQQEWAA